MSTQAPSQLRHGLRVATLNVWGLPWGLARDVPQRMQAIGERLAQLELDLIGFQEVWTRQSHETLISLGRDAGFEHRWQHRVGLRGSGLLVLSRHKIQEEHFEAFRVCGLPYRVDHGDYYGGKGFALLRIDTPLGPIRVLNTHLHAEYAEDGGTDLYRGIRAGQVVQLATDLIDVREPLIALGDFNVREARPEYRILSGVSQLRDVAVELDRRQPTTVGSSPYRGGGHVGDERIDYVFVRDGSEVALRPRSVQTIFTEAFPVSGHPGTYSDHLGLLAHIELRKQAGVAAVPKRDALQLAHRELSRGVAQARRRRRDQRGVAAASAVAGLVAGGASRQTRRHFLRWGGGSLAALALVGTGGFAWLAESVSRNEAEELEALRQQLVPLS